VRVYPPPGPWQREHAARAGLFELPVFEVFKQVVRGLLGDATGQLNVYAVTAEPQPTTAALMAALRAPMPVELSVRGEALAAALRAPGAPVMAEVLAPEEMFVDLTIGVDLGYADVIVVQAPAEIDDVLVPLAREYEAAIEAYEAEVDEIGDVFEFTERLGRLLALGNS
jgi:hypothetical protein